MLLPVDLGAGVQGVEVRDVQELHNSRARLACLVCVCDQSMQPGSCSKCCKTAQWLNRAASMAAVRPKPSVTINASWGRFCSDAMSLEATAPAMPGHNFTVWLAMLLPSLM